MKLNIQLKPKLSVNSTFKYPSFNHKSFTNYLTSHERTIAKRIGKPAKFIFASCLVFKQQCRFHNVYGKVRMGFRQLHEVTPTNLSSSPNKTRLIPFVNKIFYSFKKIIDNVSHLVFKYLCLVFFKIIFNPRKLHHCMA